MIRRRKLLICLGVLVGFVACLLAWQLLFKGPEQIGPEAYSRIQPGMTRSEVHATLGIPPGNYVDWTYKRSRSKFSSTRERARWGILGHHDYQGRVVVAPDSGKEITLDSWIGDNYWIQVTFDDEEQAIGCVLDHVETDNYELTGAYYIDRSKQAFKRFWEWCVSAFW